MNYHVQYHFDENDNETRDGMANSNSERNAKERKRASEKQRGVARHDSTFYRHADDNDERER